MMSSTAGVHGLARRHVLPFVAPTFPVPQMSEDNNYIHTLEHRNKSRTFHL